jgi:hypothetical protein
MRRDHTKYLGLIEAVALLHQYQRPIKEAAHRGKVIRYVEVTRADIEQASRLAAEVLRVTTDDLPVSAETLGRPHPNLPACRVENWLAC